MPTNTTEALLFSPSKGRRVPRSLECTDGGQGDQNTPRCHSTQTRSHFFLLRPLRLTFLWGDLYNAEIHEEWQNEPVRYANVLLRATCVRSPKLLASGTQKGILEVHSSWHIWSCHGNGGKQRKYPIWLGKESEPGSPCCKPKLGTSV